MLKSANHLLRASRVLTAQSGSRLFQSTTHRSWNVAVGSSSGTVRSITTSFRLPDPADDPHAVELTKIVATIGPTSEQAQPLLEVTGAGMKIMRLNFSHATKEEVEMRCTNLAAAEVSTVG